MVISNILATSSGVSVLPLYAGKVWVGVAPRKLFQTQSEEPYLVRWAVFCEAVECVRSRHRLASDGLNHVLIFTMGVAATVLNSVEGTQ